MVVARDWRGWGQEGNGGLLFNSYNVSVTQMNIFQRSALQLGAQSQWYSIGHLQICQECKSPVKCLQHSKIKIRAIWWVFHKGKFVLNLCLFQFLLLNILRKVPGNDFPFLSFFFLNFITQQNKKLEILGGGEYLLLLKGVKLWYQKSGPGRMQHSLMGKRVDSGVGAPGSTPPRSTLPCPASYRVPLKPQEIALALWEMGVVSHGDSFSM